MAQMARSPFKFAMMFHGFSTYLIIVISIIIVTAAQKTAHLISLFLLLFLFANTYYRLFSATENCALIVHIPLRGQGDYRFRTASLN